VLEQLKLRNGQSQKVDGNISDFMNPDVAKIKKIIAMEKEANRKLDCNAVMPTGEPHIM
jgi:hypothetical protein